MYAVVAMHCSLFHLHVYQRELQLPVLEAIRAVVGGTVVDCLEGREIKMES